MVHMVSKTIGTYAMLDEHHAQRRDFMARHDRIQRNELRRNRYAQVEFKGKIQALNEEKENAPRQHKPRMQALRFKYAGAKIARDRKAIKAEADDLETTHKSRMREIVVDIARMTALLKAYQEREAVILELQASGVSEPPGYLAYVSSGASARC